MYAPASCCWLSLAVERCAHIPSARRASVRAAMHCRGGSWPPPIRSMHPLGDSPRRSTCAPPRASIARRRRIRFVARSSRHERTQALEGVAEFYAPALAASLNSRRQEVDDDDAPPPSSLAPGGFPALEPLVWPGIARDSVPRARVLLDGMRRVVARVRALSSALAPSDAQLIELARLEVARVSTLGIAGFDAPMTRASMREAADALDGVRLLYADAAPAWWPSLGAQRRAIDSTFFRAESYLRAHPDFESFDRLVFIAIYAEPAAQAIDALRRAAGTTAVRIPRGWRADAASVYDAGAFNPRAYAATNAPVPTPIVVALGRRLFSEPALSGTGTRSCASCHSPSHAFTDGLPARRASMDMGSWPTYADVAQRRARAGAVCRRAGGHARGTGRSRSRKRWRNGELGRSRGSGRSRAAETTPRSLREASVGRPTAR